MSATGTSFLNIHYDTSGRLLAETDENQILRRAYVYAEMEPVAQFALDPSTDPRPLPYDHGNVRGKRQGPSTGKGRDTVLAKRPPMPQQAKRPGGKRVGATSVLRHAPAS